MKVLVINAGSSSCKYQLLEMDTETVLASGLAERIGQGMGKLTHKIAPDSDHEEKIVRESAFPTHVEAMELVISLLTDPEKGVIKDDKGVPVFAMCINQNISRQMAAIAALEDQIRTAPAEDSRNDGTQETFAATSEETMEAIVRKVLQQFGKLPTELDREERIALIAQFDQHGAFRFKGMVEHIASIMGISKYTLYSYRKACRQGPANGPQDPELPS